MLLCPADYIYNPLTPYRQEIFKRLVAEVKGGDVLDLGCDHVGHYWALGYAARVQSYSLYDYNADSVERQQNEIESLSGDKLNEYFSETIEFLMQENLLPANTDMDQIAEWMIGKLDQCDTYDYLNSTPEREFDYIIAVESLEAVHSTKDFEKALANVKSLLKPSGKLVTIILPWDEENEDITERVEAGREGLWNPNIDQILTSLAKSGFQGVQHSHYKTLMDNYTNAWFITAQK